MNGFEGASLNANIVDITAWAQEHIICLQVLKQITFSYGLQYAWTCRTLTFLLMRSSIN